MKKVIIFILVLAISAGVKYIVDVANDPEPRKSVNPFSV